MNDILSYRRHNEKSKRNLLCSGYRAAMNADRILCGSVPTKTPPNKAVPFGEYMPFAHKCVRTMASAADLRGNTFAVASICNVFDINKRSERTSFCEAVRIFHIWQTIWDLICVLALWGKNKGIAAIRLAASGAHPCRI